MRIAIVHFLHTQNDTHASVLKNLGKGAVANGHTVDIFNGFTDADSIRLTGFDYITIVVPVTTTFSGKVPVRVSELLSSSGTISGKKGCALVLKSSFASRRTCKNLMKIMESEGIVVDYFDVLLSADHASAVSKKLG